MHKLTCGFIGSGNMGSALCTAASRSDGNMDILVSDHTPEKAEKLASSVNGTASTNSFISKCSDFIFLGVKPQKMELLAQEIHPFLASRTDHFILVSMAAGISISQLEQWFGPSIPIIRIMPNTAVSVGEGIILYSPNDAASDTDCHNLDQILSNAGLLLRIQESQMDAAGTVSSCAPAFADLFMEALADGGVACGLPRGLSLSLASQMLVGSGKLQISSLSHPGQLKDAVCSPAGSTIQGVRTLEEHAFRGAVIDAVIASYEKNRRMV